MAKEGIIKVREVEVIPRPSQYGNGVFNLLQIIDDLGEVYTGRLSDKLYIPEKGESIKVDYQVVSGSRNRYILTMKSNEDKSMVKVTTGITLSATPQNSSGSSEVESKPFKIKGTLFYPCLKEPQTKGKFPSNKYTVDVSVSNALKSTLEGLGVFVNNKGDEKGNYIRLKSKFKPTIIGEDGTKLENPPLIGNGTRAMLTVSLYPNKATQGGKNCLGFSTVELIDLIEYIPDSPKPLIDE